MDYKHFSQIPHGINDIKYQCTPQNGAILLAKLQQKVARLELMLRDKETALSKLHSSTKASYVNELQIQTEVYYQEVLRLKNHLNLLEDDPKHLPRLQAAETPPKQQPRNPEVKKEASTQPVDKTLIKSLEKLKEENEKLSHKLLSVQAEKERLNTDFEKVLQITKDRELDKPSPRVEGFTQTSPKHDPVVIQEVSEVSLDTLKSQVEELQMREKAWEQERATYKDLVLSLKEDRLLFKDTSQKRNDELWALQSELAKLQKEIGGFQLNGKPLCRQCSKPSQRSSKSKRSSVKDSSCTNTHRSPSSQKSAPSSAGKPPKPVSTSATPPKRLPTPQKTRSREGSSAVVSKSSTTSSCSSSPNSSPSHPTRSNPRSLTRTLSERTTTPSIRSNASSSRNSSRTSVDGNSLAEGKSSLPPSPLKRCPPHPSPLSTPSIKSPRVVTQASKVSSPSSSAGTNGSLSKLNSNQEDEQIASEILKGLDSLEINHSSVQKRSSLPKSSSGSGKDSASSDHSLHSPRSIPKPVAKAENRIPAPEPHQQEVKKPVLDETDQVEREERIDNFLGLLESHFRRKKKLEEFRATSDNKSSPQSKSNLKSPPAKSPAKSPTKTKAPLSSRSPVKKSPVKHATKVRSPLFSPRKGPVKPPRANATQQKVDDASEEPQNVKDIDLMISLLEGHIAREAFLALVRDRSS